MVGLESDQVWLNLWFPAAQWFSLPSGVEPGLKLLEQEPWGLGPFRFRCVLSLLPSPQKPHPRGSWAAERGGVGTQPGSGWGPWWSPRGQRRTWLHHQLFHIIRYDLVLVRFLNNILEFLSDTCSSRYRIRISELWKNTVRNDIVKIRTSQFSPNILPPRCSCSL